MFCCKLRRDIHIKMCAIDYWFQSEQVCDWGVKVVMYSCDQGLVKLSKRPSQELQNSINQKNKLLHVATCFIHRLAIFDSGFKLMG